MGKYTTHESFNGRNYINHEDFGGTVKEMIERECQGLTALAIQDIIKDRIDDDCLVIGGISLLPFYMRIAVERAKTEAIQDMYIHTITGWNNRRFDIEMRDAFGRKTIKRFIKDTPKTKYNFIG